MSLVIVSKSKILSILCLLTFAFTSNAQVDSSLYNAKPRYVKRAGKKAFKNGDYFGAISYLKKFNEQRPEHIGMKYLLAESYRLSRDYENAAKTYHEIVKVEEEGYEKAYFYLGQMQIYNGDYEKAIISLEKWKRTYDGKDKNDFSKYQKYLLETCEKAPGIIDEPLDVAVTHVDTSINKAHVELSPLPLTKDKILYSSLRSDSVVYINAEDSTARIPVRRFYTAERVDSNWHFSGEYTEGPFNKDRTHNGNGTFNLDSSVFYFTRCERNWKGNVICAIYESKKTANGDWGEPVKMPEPINLPDFHSTQPTIGWDSRKEVQVLYFVSDRDESGHRGGKDIWYCQYYPRREEWKKPRNAGSKINTRMDEMTPFYDMETKTMYFSSEGWPGVGGFDIFSTTGELKQWEEPVNIGYPINSSVDELYYTLLPGKDEGFFVSNRIGSVALKNPTCCDDIYHFRELHFIYLAVEGKIMQLPDKKAAENGDSIRPVPGMAIDLYVISDSTEPLFLTSKKADAEGRYFFNLQKEKQYMLKIEDEKFFSSTHEISTIDAEKSDTLKKDFLMTPISQEPIVIKNIYYEFDKDNLTDTSKATIDTTLLNILRDNPSIIIEIGSHTDSRGSDKYNEDLSQRRAQSVVNYLISKGIERDRLKAKGYGEKQPIAPNENEDGSDNPAGRAMNRRTEFRVVGQVEGASHIIYKE